MKYDQILGAVLGVSDYKKWSDPDELVLETLQGVDASMRKFRDIIITLGGEVKVNAPNVTSEQLRDSIYEIGKQLDANSKTAVLIYLIGHGNVRDSTLSHEQGYFVCYPQQATGKISRDTVDFSTFRNEFSDVLQKAHHVLFLLDCCHSGVAIPDAVPQAMGPVPPTDFPKPEHGSLEFYFRNPSTQILSATGASQNAYVDRDGSWVVKKISNQLAHTPVMSASQLCAAVGSNSKTWMQMPKIEQVRRKNESTAEFGEFVFGIGTSEDETTDLIGLELWNKVLVDPNLARLVSRVRNVALKKLKLLVASGRYPHLAFFQPAHLMDMLEILDDRILGKRGIVDLHMAPFHAAVIIMAIHVFPFALAPFEEWFVEFGNEESNLRGRFERFSRPYDALAQRMDAVLEPQPSPGFSQSTDEKLFGHLFRAFLQEELAESFGNNLQQWLSELKGDDKRFFVVDSAKQADKKTNFQPYVEKVAQAAFHEVGWLRQFQNSSNPLDKYLSSCGDLVQLAALMSFDVCHQPDYFLNEISFLSRSDSADKNRFLSWENDYRQVRNRWIGFCTEQESSAGYDSLDTQVENASVSTPLLALPKDKRIWLKFSQSQCQHPVHQQYFHDRCEDVQHAWRLFSHEVSANGIGFTVPPLNVVPKVQPKRVPKEDGEPLYKFNPLKFELTQQKILDMLMGERIYGDPALAIRELIQNALDTLERRHQQENRRRSDSPGKLPNLEKLCIEVTWDEEENSLTIRDYGSGMDTETITKYFAQIGESFYRSPEFEREKRELREAGYHLTPVSQFGIGILSCFMIADRVYVRTNPSPAVYRSVDSDRKSGKDPRSNVWLQGVGSMFYFEGKGTKPRKGSSLFLDEHEYGTEITLFLKKSEFKIAHRPNDWLPQLEYDFGYSDEKVNQPQDKEKRKKEEVVSIDPAYLIGRYFVWPTYPIVLPQTEVGSIGQEFHLQHLFPIDSNAIRKTGWKPPLPGDVQWCFYDWIDNTDRQDTDQQDTDQQKATGSRIRLIYPGDARHAAQSTFPPQRIGNLELADLAAIVETQQPVVSQQLLVNGMFIPDSNACEVKLDFRGRIGAMVWIDLRGAAAPPLSINRLRVVSSGKDWRRTENVMTGVVNRFVDAFEAEAQRLETEEANSIDQPDRQVNALSYRIQNSGFSGLAGPFSLWNKTLSKTGLQKKLPHEKTDEKEVVKWLVPQNNYSVEFGLLKLMLLQNTAARDSKRFMERFIRGQAMSTAQGETDFRDHLNDEFDMQEMIEQFGLLEDGDHDDFVSQSKDGGPKKTDNRFLTLAEGQGVWSTANKVVTRARDTLRDFVTTLLPMITTEEGFKDFRDSLNKKKAFKNVSDFRAPFTRHELLGHVASLLNLKPEPETGWFRSGPALFQDEEERSIQHSPYVDWMTQYDIVFPYTAHFQGKLADVVNEKIRSEEKGIERSLAVLRILVGIPFLLPDPTIVHWSSLNVANAQLFHGIERINAVIPARELWYLPYAEWEFHDDLYEHCLVGTWNLVEGTVGFQRGLIPVSRLISTSHSKTSHIEDIEAKRPPNMAVSTIEVAQKVSGRKKLSDKERNRIRKEQDRKERQRKRDQKRPPIFVEPQGADDIWLASQIQGVEGYQTLCSSNSSAIVRWQPDRVKAGKYDVWFYHVVGHATNSEKVEFQIQTASANHPVEFDLRNQERGWKVLGTYEFGGDKAEWIQLTNVSEGTVRVNVIKLVPG